jgi:hypothetical protein
MTAAAAEEDTTTTMAADRGPKSGQVLEGGGVAGFIFSNTNNTGWYHQQ